MVRKTIVLDERDIDIVVDARSGNTKPFLRKLSLAGFIAIVIGGIIFTSGHYYGFAIMGAGAIVLGFAVLKASREKKKSRRYFMDYLDAYHEMPPWTEKSGNEADH